MDQLLTCMRFYASAGHLASVADFMGVHLSTVSRIIKRVSYALAGLLQQYIHMPEGNTIARTQNEFFGIASFPRVLGCVDCTHIQLQSPGGEDAEIFRNRKGFFSINVQVVSDVTLKIRDMVVRWPGSTHDMTIFSNSRIKARFEAGEFGNGILLGDSGYALSRFLLTPLLNPNNPGETLYNESHIRTRFTIERLFGVWKRRFPVLAYGLRLKLDTVFALIVGAAVLHNIAREMNEEEPPLLIDEEGTFLIIMNKTFHLDEREKVRVSFFQQTKPQEVDLPDEPIILDTDYIMAAATAINDSNHISYNRQESTDSGWDNPFRPGGDLSREADEIVELIKGGKPITPTSGGNASPPLLDQTDSILEQNNILHTSTVPLTKQSNEPITESPKKVNNDLHATPKSATNGNLQNDTKPGALDVQRGTIVPQTPVDPNQVEYVVIKKKPKCKCCVIQ